MAFHKRMRYGGGLQDEAVPLRLVNYPPVITWRARLVAARSSQDLASWRRGIDERLYGRFLYMISHKVTDCHAAWLVISFFGMPC